MYELTNIAIGETGIIAGLGSTGSIRRRLLDLGFVKGSPVTCLFAGPSGEPRAYLIKHSVIALRTEDARTVFLTGKEQHGEII